VLPADAGANTGPSLYSIACPSAGNCSAVGTYVDSSNYSQGLLLSQSANVWSAGQKAPLPPNAGSNPAVDIYSVSCVSADNCTAVGTYHESASNVQGLLLSESGGAWSAIEAPLPGDADAVNTHVLLNGVSCSSSGNCTAVGSYVNSSGSQGLLLNESSGAWTATRATLPNGVTSKSPINLNEVSCASAGNCVAIGYYTDSLTHTQPLLESQSSGTWTPITPPLPAGGSTGVGNALVSVSCPSAGNCAVTGSYQDSSAHTQGLLLRESSGTWTPIKALLPADAGTDPRVSVGSVSCASAGECTAVGYYHDASGHSQALVLGESSGAWSAGIRASFPSDAGVNATGFLGLVSCASAGNCSAVGGYTDSSGNGQGLLVSESSGTWSTGIRAPLPADAGSNPFVELDAVSCATAASCSIVGNYEDSSNTTPGLLVSAVPASPTLTLSAPTTGTVGSTLALSTVAAGLSAGASPVGTITFTVFGPQASPPGSCATGGTIVGSASVSGNGTYHPSAGFTPASAGNYWWYASYSGDASNNPAASTCGAQMPDMVVASKGGGTGVGTLRVSHVNVVGSILRMLLSCTGGPCDVTLKLIGTETLKGNRVIAVNAATRKHKVVTFGTAHVALTAGQSTTIQLALNATAKRLLAKFHHLKAKLNISESGKLLSSETVTFRATKHKTARLRR
jgi:hypothetical protein